MIGKIFFPIIFVDNRVTFEATKVLKHTHLLNPIAMKNKLKYGFLTLIFSLALSACSSNKSGNDGGSDTQPAALDSTSTDTLGATGNDSIQ